MKIFLCNHDESKYCLSNRGEVAAKIKAMEAYIPDQDGEINYELEENWENAREHGDRED